MKKILIITTAALMALATVALGQGTGQGMGQGQPGCDGSMRMQGPGGKGMPGSGCNMHGPRGHGKKGGEPGFGMLLNFKDELELTQAQIDQFKKLTNDFALEKIDRKADLEKAHVKLRTLIRDDAGESQVNAAIDEVAGLKAAMQKMRFSHQKQMQSILTEAQSQKLKQLQQEKRACFRNQRNFDDDDDMDMPCQRRGKI